MKVLNLYAGIGGNRKLWEDVEVTAVEFNPEIAAIYQEYFPDDTVVVADAHQYLLDHYKEFEFIWCSPPCPSHSRARYWRSKGGTCSVVYPDMVLWQEIIFLQHYFRGAFVVENVQPFYPPLIQPTCKIGRHALWTNFAVSKKSVKLSATTSPTDLKVSKGNFGFSLDGKTTSSRRDQILRNLVDPAIGLFLLEQARLNSYALSPSQYSMLEDMP